MSDRFVSKKKKHKFILFFILIIAPFFELGYSVYGIFNEESVILTNVVLVFSFAFVFYVLGRNKK